MTRQECLLGAHTSAAGGVQNALYEGQKIGATTIQLFTSNQRQWKARSLSHETVTAWHKALEETGLKCIMSHDSYLINLGSADPDVLCKSRAAFREELIRCLQLGVTFCNFHPGSAVNQTVPACLDRIAESLIQVKDLFEKHPPLTLLLENTAGQGSTVGVTFEELAYIIERVENDVPIGVCIDTCHVFAAGYDIRTREHLNRCLANFDHVIGLEYLKAMHLNDSQKGLGSRIDRHASIGEGLLGVECFRAIMQESRLSPIPKYLETPGGPPVWEKEIELLRSFARSKD